MIRLRGELDRLDAQPFDALEVAAVVGEKRQAALERGRGDQEVEVADHLPRCAQTAALSTEGLAYLLVDAQSAESEKKVAQFALACSRITRMVRALVQFSDGHRRDPDPVRSACVEACHNPCVCVQILDDPIRIDDVLHTHRRGLGRVVIRRSR
jgi:hypothetical protein